MEGSLLMITNITTERKYTVSYFKSQAKDSIGVSVSVTHDSKKRAMQDANEMWEQATLFAKEHGKSIDKVVDNVL
jgi:hypothetical protein